ncbi:MAG: hypothetical protein FWH31_00920 [Streptococcaceae bacterium]|nr:hypothetical protein [Streptococcaceae bacterium]
MTRIEAMPNGNQTDSRAIFSHSFWCCELNYTKMGIRFARNDENFVL